MFLLIRIKEKQIDFLMLKKKNEFFFEKVTF